MSEQVRNNISQVFLCGGYNDRAATVADISNAVISCVNRAKVLFPNAIIYTGEVCYISNATQKANVVEGYQASPNAIYIPGQDILSASDLVDGIHPDQNGQNKIGQFIYTFINS